MAIKLIIETTLDSSVFKIKTDSTFNQFETYPKIYTLEKTRIAFTPESEVFVTLKNVNDNSLLLDGCKVDEIQVNGTSYASFSELSEALVPLLFKRGGDSGFGGINKRVVLANTFVNDTVTRLNIPLWSFPVKAGKLYKIKILGAYSTPVITTGGSLGVVLSNGGVGTIFGTIKMNIVHTAAATPEQVITAINTINTTARSFTTSTGVGTVNIPEGIEGELIFECTTAGTFNLQWGSEVAASAASLLKNSILEITEL